MSVDFGESGRLNGMKQMQGLGRLVAVALSAWFCLMGMVPMGRAAQDAEVVHNLVLFAQFADAQQENFMEGRAERIQTLCEDRGTVRSLAGYVDVISYGKMQIACHYPQLENGAITPYQLSGTQDSYWNVDLVALEILREVSVPEDTPLDGNGDGMVDNVILILDTTEAGANGTYWPCAFSLTGVSINGKETGRVNLLNDIAVFECTISGGAGVICHEFLHSIGYPDLYRADDRSGTPVGAWDIMASNSIFMQYPLAYLRTSASGWLEAKDITENGTYTLSAASADHGNRLYLLKTPLSDTEFFAVEYRQQGTPFSEEMDVKICGSGLVVYRVNTEVDGNRKSDRDQIYVFRPGETQLDAGEGTLSQSNYGGAGSPNEIGSLDLSAGVADGALVYSDGTNSGIRLSEITMNGESLSFAAEFAPVADQELWKSAANASPLAGTSSLDLAVSESGVVHLFCENESGGTLYRLSDGALTRISAITGSCYQPKLAFVGDTPYVLYHDAAYRPVLARYDGAWDTVYQGDVLSQYTDLAAADGRVYLCETIGEFPYVLQVKCYDPQSGDCALLGQTIAENACNVSVTANADGVMVGYRDLADANKPKLSVWAQGAWQTHTLSESGCDAVVATADAQTVQIAVTGKSEGMYRYEDGVITQTALPVGAGACFGATPLLNGGQLFVMMNTQ